MPEESGGTTTATADPKVPTSCVAYGPKKGAGAGVVDEMLNDFACGKNAIYWVITKQIAHTIPGKGAYRGRHGAVFFHPFNFANSYITALTSRVNPLNLLTPLINGCLINFYGLQRYPGQIPARLMRRGWFDVPNWPIRSFSEEDGCAISGVAYPTMASNSSLHAEAVRAATAPQHTRPRAA